MDDDTIYDYQYNDAKNFARQVIVDRKLGLVITIDFVKNVHGQTGMVFAVSDHSRGKGGDWIVSMQVDALDQKADLSKSYSLFLSVAGENKDMSVQRDGQGNIVLIGQDEELGAFEMVFFKSKNEIYSAPLIIDIPIRDAWKVKDILQGSFSATAQKLYQQNQETFETVEEPSKLYRLPERLGEGKLLILQKTFSVPFKFEYSFQSGVVGAPGNLEAQVESAQGLFAKILKTAQTHAKAFDKKFESVFQVKAKGFTGAVDFARITFSNLLGGIGYFSGNSLIDRSKMEDDPFAFAANTKDDLELDSLLGRDDSAEVEEKFDDLKKEILAEFSEDMVLFSATPSRPFFPRGFLWDEGFHLTPIVMFDPSLAFEIINSWLSLMDKDGWIAREQILGEEARSKVPSEFQTQFPDYANPPTLILPLLVFLDNWEMNVAPDAGPEVVIAGSDFFSDLYRHDAQFVKSTVKALYEKFRKHYQWLVKTQKATPIKHAVEGMQQLFRWRGRTPNHCLTSGIDDFPRANPPSKFELHVDLVSWVGFYAKSLTQIATFFGEEFANDVGEYKSMLDGVVLAISEVHWNEREQMYSDLEPDQHDEGYEFISHKGYLTLFPFIFNLIEQEDRVNAMLDLLHDPEELFSPFGIRSMSKRDKLYGGGENYWKGPIWINVNYLVLRSLKKHYIPNPLFKDKAQALYDELRSGIISNIHEQWKSTGYLWEQYGPDNGEGRRSRPFNGWTSLVLCIISEIY